MSEIAPGDYVCIGREVLTWTVLDHTHGDPTRFNLRSGQSGRVRIGEPVSNLTLFRKGAL